MQLLRPENKDFGTKWYLYDMGLSLAGKGLLTTIMMLPKKICLPDSMFYRICGDTKEVVNKIFEELEKLNMFFILNQMIPILFTKNQI